VVDPRPLGAGGNGLLAVLRRGPLRHRCGSTRPAVPRDRGERELPQDCREANRCLRPM
jgi:hypothetical protein